MTVSFDAAGVMSFADDLAKSPSFVARQGRTFIGEAADDLAKAWKSNAEVTSGEHGKHYPKTIDWRWLLSTGAAAEVGPLRGRQSQMSFELGSSNQPPHLDGLRALDVVGPRLLRRFDQLQVLS